MSPRLLGCLAFLFAFGCAHNTEEIRDLQREVVYLHSKMDVMQTQIAELQDSLAAMQGKDHLQQFEEGLRHQTQAIDSLDRLIQERARESEVKSNMHFLQLAIEDYKTSPGLEGITPKNIQELKKRIPLSKQLKNPFTGSQRVEDIFVDGWPKQAGQAGYLSPCDTSGVRLGYRIVGRGREGYLRLVLEEGK